jgi:hypothetical protein
MRLPRRACHDLSVPARVERLRAQTQAGQADADSTSGLVAYLGGAPAGWCAVGLRDRAARAPSRLSRDNPS